MAEIYRNTSQKVYLDVYGGTSTGLTANLYVGDSSTPVPLSVVSETPLAGATERWSVYLGLTYTGNDDSLRVVWSFSINSEPVTVEHDYQVVTPFATVDEIKAAMSVPASKTDDQIKRVERRVRKKIQNITRQTFGRWAGVKTIVGTGESKVRLPDRIITLNSVTGPYAVAVTGYALRNDGWWLEVAPLAPDGDWVFTNVIADPTDMFGGFSADVEYQVDALWGYYDVPDDIKEAALLLIEDELCPSSEFRNKYLKSVTYADTDLEFDGRAWYGTGNASVDNLLAAHVRTNLSVI